MNHQILGDMVEIKHGFAFSSQYFKPNGPYILLTPGNFYEEGGYKVRSEQKHYDGPVPAAFVLKPGDLLVAMTEQGEGLLGSAAFVPDGKPCLHNQRLGLIMPKPGVAVDLRYVYYVLNWQSVRQQIRATSSGAKIRHTSPSRICAVNIPRHPFETQRRIAEILGAYDDLIEVNRRRIAMLEEMARGLFTEWFTRLRFPGHEDVIIEDTPDGPLPKGWHYAPLDAITEVAFGYAFKSKAFSTVPEGARVVRIRDVPDGTTKTWTTEPFDARYGVVNGDILVGMDGIFHMAMWVGGDAALNQRVTRLRPINGYSKGWVFLSVYPHIKFFEATISGTTVAHLGAKHLSTIRVLVADPVTQAKADKFFAPIDKELVNLRVENLRLATARDLLLPRLISGQLSVAQARRELKAA
ncbi:restriction endonuclease subunit S [Burkholderia pseudomallei]|jgi:type I restriction enzyme S subunit|uniref:restriction endonuclease subunit S n=1 Tax=Burkholderia pseudomallei TaxID=28450 RepID=UPI0034DE9CDF